MCVTTASPRIIMVSFVDGRSSRMTSLVVASGKSTDNSNRELDPEYISLVRSKGETTDIVGVITAGLAAVTGRRKYYIILI